MPASLSAEYVKVPEASRRLRIQPDTLRQHFAKRTVVWATLQPFKLDGMRDWFISVDRIEAYLAQGQLEAAGRVVRLDRKGK
jgi:hypothetical protein